MEKPSKPDHNPNAVWFANVRDNQIGIDGTDGITSEVAADLGYNPPTSPSDKQYWPNKEQIAAADEGLNKPGAIWGTVSEGNPNNPIVIKRNADKAQDEREAAEANNPSQPSSEQPELPYQPTEPY